MAQSSVDQLLEPHIVDDVVSPLGAEYVVAPDSLDAASEILRAASERSMQTLLHGSGTHQGIGYPVSPDLVVSTARLNSVVAYEPEDLTLVVGSGMTVGAVNALLDERGQTAVLPEQSDDATIGGVVAAGLSGWQRLGHGPIRDRMLEVELITGDGRHVTGGGRVVKNVSGYDIPRLATGSLGSLGLIGTVCLKLWPKPAHLAAINVADPVAARARAYRPLAIIETNRGSAVYVAGTREEIAGQADDLGSEAMEDVGWPEPMPGAYQFSIRVPAAMTAAAVTRVKSLGSAVAFQAAHGIGDVKLAADDLDLQALIELRRWAESTTGALVMTDAPPATYDVFDPWGTPPPTLKLQRRIKQAFDPAGILNTGRLPGRL